MKKLAIVAVPLALGILSVRACSKRPDERLRDHFSQLCAVARDGADEPRRGVDRFFSFFGDNGPEMLQSFGALLVEIERIPDDRRHDQRAAEARDRMFAPLIACGDSFERFADAVE